MKGNNFWTAGWAAALCSLVAAAGVTVTQGSPAFFPARQLPACRPNVREDPTAIHARMAAVQAQPASVLPKIELARCFDLTWQFEHVEQAIQQAQEAFEAELAARPPRERASDALPVAAVDVPLPQRQSGAAPEYPDEARAFDAAGVVVVEARVDLEGRVVDARIARSVKGLDAAALRAVNTWRYARPLVPSHTGGVRMYLPIKFGHVTGLQPSDYLDLADFYYGHEEYQLVRAALQMGKMAARTEIARYGRIHILDALPKGPDLLMPKVVQDVKPKYTATARAEKIAGDMELYILIDREGVVGRASVVRPLPYLNLVGQEAAIRWRFTPALLSGEKVSVIAELRLTFKLY